MRSSQKQIRDILFVKTSYLILLFIVSVLLIINGRSALALLIIITSMAVLLISAGWFTHFFLPELSFQILVKILGDAIFQGFLSNFAVTKIKDGKIVNGQNVRSKFKRNSLIFIDRNSAVIYQNKQTGYIILRSGIHYLPRSTSIYAVLPTTPQMITFGPESADSLSKAQGGEGLADFHVRVNAAKRTAMKASDGIIVYAKIECFYKIDGQDPNEGILTLTKSLLEKNGSLPVLTTDFIQRHLLNLALAQWKKVCAIKSSGQLIDETPLKLNLDQAAKYGLKCLVYVSDVFPEGSRNLK